MVFLNVLLAFKFLAFPQIFGERLKIVLVCKRHMMALESTSLFKGFLAQLLSEFIVV